MFKKVLSTFGAKVITAISNLALLYLTVHYMGATQRGNISIVILNLSFVMLFAEWIAGPTLVYFFAKFQTKSIVTMAYKWIAFTLVLVLLIYQVLPLKFNLIYYALLCLFQISISLHNQLLIAFSKIRYFNLLTILQALLTLLFVSISIFLGYRNADYYFYGLILSSAIIYALHLYFYFYKIEASTTHNKVGFTEVFKQSNYTFSTNAAHLITNRISYFYISIYCGAAALGVYSTSVSLAETILLAATSIATIHYSNIANSNNVNVNRRLTKLYLKYSVAISVAGILVVMLIPAIWFLQIFGVQFIDVKVFILMYSPAIIAMSATLILTHYFSGTGNFKISFVAGIISCFVVILFSKFVIETYMQKGLLALNSVALLVQAIILYVAFYREKTNV